MISIGLGLGLPFRNNYMQSVWSVLSLFAAGEQGVWYDPSDYTTMFQDSAGTTPVTAVEQPVGLLLDKSKGLVLGPELLGAYTTFNGATVVSGLITLTTTSATDVYVQQSFTTVVGKTYLLTYRKITGVGVASNLYFAIGQTAGATQSYAGTQGTNPAGTYSIRFQATTTTTWIQIANITDTPTTTQLDSVSTKLLDGNHATQATSTKRPVLSARYNLLTKTEDFSSADWNDRTGTTPVANTVLSPTGTLTGNTLSETATTGMHYVSHSVISGIVGTSYRAFVYLKQGTSRYAGLDLSISNTTDRYSVIIDLQTQTFASQSVSQLTNTSYVVEPLANGWTKLSISASTVNPTINIFAGVFLSDAATPTNWGQYQIPTYTGNTANNIYIWGASLAPADQASLPYQRVNTATDYNAVGYKPYLKFDGIDDALATGSIDFTSTDKMTVWSGVRKLSDAAIGIYVELSAGAPSELGVFNLYNINAAGSYAFGSKGSAQSSATTTSYSAPTTNVLTGIGAILTDVDILRVNGTQSATSSTDQGTGNYGNWPLYIGSRAGTSLPFNGNIYSLIVRGAQSTTPQVTNTETYVNGKTGAY